jgi:hypothetical protein
LLDDVRQLAEIESDAERARMASKLLAELQAGISETSRLRRESIARLRAQGHSLADIADIIGVSRARIAQLRQAGPPPERALLGFDTLTVAIPLKRESQYGRPAVAQEDFAAFNALADLARDLQLGAEVEYIQLGGNVDLNRDNLVVICGPRISPLIAEVLRSDPVLQFERDDSGWFLTDRRTGHTYHSPSDNPALPPGDVAYLSRQARPDGNGSFILLTGIHAVGSNGVIHYLIRELADLYEQVGTRLFSTLIASEYDVATRTITSSRRITPLYLHEDA